METSKREVSSFPSRARPSRRQTQTLPPSPPDTDKESTDQGSELSDAETTTRWPDRSRLSARKLPLYTLPPKNRPGNAVLSEDLNTPDSHVVRDPRLIRLTGTHPFNVEAPLSDLYDEGFLTTKDLHYVRNHGPVPKVEDTDVMEWDFTIEGMVNKPIRMSLAQLIEDYEQVTYPVTLVCAGNRRKEQNVVRQTKGFSWGAAGLSTALWTGVAISDLIRAAMPRRGARYVCFEGADKLPNGYYGTSIKMSWALDPERGVLLAHKMNGEALPPDHGKPLRVVIPGQIGGRSVKWLKKIIITKEPSGNWYHIYDNRVLPTMVDPEMSAGLPETWKDERYAIYDLNTNSATCYPAHNEELSLQEPDTIYKVRGYAYAGGGKRITRVEVTLDRGKTWVLANISYPEDQYRLAPEGETLYGGRLDVAWRESSFCWCFWSLNISISQLQRADDIMVRAMDEAMMVQPREMYWSVLGMMNNPWFRIVIHKEGQKLRFEHPTQPALMPGGWMERVKKAGGNLMNGYWGEQLNGIPEAAEPVEPSKEICMTNRKVSRTITLDELKNHSGESEPWFVIHGEVYDGTQFLEEHPGGPTSITGAAGQDASEDFLAIHSENAKAMLVDYHIGTLDKTSQRLLATATTKAATTSTSAATSANVLPRAVFLQPSIWSKATLAAKTSVSPDTRLFTFDLEHAAQTVGLPVGQHLTLRLRDPATGAAVQRAYTPISHSSSASGKLDLLVKVYNCGRMTQALDALALGQTAEFRGPHGNFTYIGHGRCAVATGSGRLRERHVRRFIMVCGGTGITPILAVLRAVLTDSTDAATSCVLLDANRSEADILCRAEIDALRAAATTTSPPITAKNNRHERRCRVTHVLSRPGPGWTGARGYIDKDLVTREVGPGPSTASNDGDGDELVLICGPKLFEESMRAIFLEMGWKREDLVFF
ncbi:nitrate reductase [Nemania sp. FL0916]|nr:nitrate reductase [Nemania sp. FL0916]